MQKSILQKAALTVIIVLALMFCSGILLKAGVQPLMAAIAIIFLKGFIRFLYRITVMLVSVAIVVAILIFLACHWL